MAKNKIRFNVRTVRMNEDLKYYSNFKLSLKPRNDELVNLLPGDVSDSTFINGFSKKCGEMNGSELASLCQKYIKRKNTSSGFWWLIYNRIKEIKYSVSIIDAILIFYIYCNSESFDKTFIDIIKMFWELIEGEVKKLPFLTLLYVYDCAEKTENIQIIIEVKDMLWDVLNHENWEKLKLSEDRLLILLRVLCKTEKNITSRCKKFICEKIKNTHFKNVKSIIYCIHFLLKYNIYDDTFKSLLNKAQFYLTFNNADIESNIKDLTDILKFKDPFVVREITRTLHIIYTSHKTNFRS